MRTRNNEPFGLALPGWVLFWPPQAGTCRAESSSVGTLRLEGQGIERLVLQDSHGELKGFDYREPDLILPAGRYRLDEIILRGGYSSVWSPIPDDRRTATIEPGGLLSVKLGAPLRQTIRVERWGRSLVLKYQLLGQGGESYSVTQRQEATPPAFTIYQGTNQVASGRFEPG